ncbi:hypothetical protein, partial [Cloacibacillus evryensis]|uniref:hypothetical protein n=1 Tax=Cloacibacillus evryensis TaxID=508460 RepID=UPI00210A27F3
LDGSLEVLLASVGLATNIMQDFLPLSYFFLLLHWGLLIFQSATFSLAIDNIKFSLTISVGSSINSTNELNNHDAMTGIVKFTTFTERRSNC